MLPEHFARRTVAIFLLTVTVSGLAPTASGVGSALASGASTPLSGVIRLNQAAGEDLGAAVSTAREVYAAAALEARDERDAALVEPRAERRVALAAAEGRSERLLVRRAYLRTTAPIRSQYMTSMRTARTTRDAAIEAALAKYLAQVGSTEQALALDAYREATTKARDTLLLALESAAHTYRTDTADEREILLTDLESAGDQRSQAWAEFLTGTSDERRAQLLAVRGARSTYFSAMRQARATFQAQTGTSIGALLRRTFGG